MIKVCDAFMGAGKTSASVNYMNAHPDKKFLYITPYIEETERIRNDCPNLHFWLPNNHQEEYEFTKRGHLKQLVTEGRNVSITHALFRLCDTETAKIIREQDYTIIIDEVVDIFSKLEVSDSDLAMIIDSGWLQIIDNGDSKAYTYDIESAPNKYQGGKFVDLFVYAASQRLTEVTDVNGGRNLWYWTLQDELFRGDNEVIILTFMFKGSVMAGFLEANGINYHMIGVSNRSGKYEFVPTPQCPPDYVGKLSEMINIVENKRMNEVGDKMYALSNNWFKTRLSHGRVGDFDAIKKHLRNFFYELNKNTPKDNRLWSTFKDAKWKLRGDGYSNAFLAFSTKATNEYRHCSALAYLVNVYHDPNIRIYLAARGATINDNDYALSTMVQWIWRSAIRDGKPISLYLPSRRMRTLLKNWIETEEEKYHIMKAATGGY